MDALKDDSWLSSQSEGAEAHWNTTMEALGPENVRSALANSGKSKTVQLNSPFECIHPLTKTVHLLDPPKLFVIDWLVAQLASAERAASKQNEQNLRLQKIALWISALATLSALLASLAAVVPVLVSQDRQDQEDAAPTATEE